MKQSWDGMELFWGGMELFWGGMELSWGDMELTWDNVELTQGNWDLSRVKKKQEDTKLNEKEKEEYKKLINMIDNPKSLTFVVTWVCRSKDLLCMRPQSRLK